MIARIWRGRTKAEHTDEYLDILRTTGIADYRGTPGNRGVWVLTRPLGDATEYAVLTLWESREAIARFAGDDIDVARYYPEDARYLLDFAETVEHYDCEIAAPPEV